MTNIGGNASILPLHGEFIRDHLLDSFVVFSFHVFADRV